MTQLRNIFILSFFLAQVSVAADVKTDVFELEIDEETSISISRFGDEGDRILWIPTEFGIQQQHEDLLASLAGLRFEIWLSELHDSYFIPTGRKSYTEIPVNDITTLIEKSIPENDRKLFIVSTGRGSALALMALQKWQQDTAKREKLGGIIMIHPNMQAETPKPGTSMRYLSIVDSTQLPIFIIQPKKSEKYWYLSNLTERLSDAGSKVYTQTIEQVGDGYHVRPDNTDHEKLVAKQLPSTISRATRLLAKTQVNFLHGDAPKDDWRLTTIPELLQPHPGNTPAPDLELFDTTGKHYDLHSFRGKVVVINFWATWCPPCIEEIPSLGRLQDAFSEDDLLVISVDIGESKKDVEVFLSQVPADFPVLLDPDGVVFKRWKVTSFPTTFVINQKGIIKLAYYGGLEWDKPEVVEQLEAMTTKKTAP